MPKVSILLTSYNHEKFLKQSIDSVLNQTFTDFELFIIDDYSTDNSWKIIESYKDPRIKKIRNRNNMGRINGKELLSKMKGEYYGVQHSDDIWEKDKLKKQVDFLDKHPKIAACFTHAEIIDEYGKPLKIKQNEINIFLEKNKTRTNWLKYFIKYGNRLCHPSSLIRKDILIKDDIFAPGLACLPDFYRWIKLCCHHDIYIIQEKLVKFRKRTNAQNVSGANEKNICRLWNEHYYICSIYYEINNEDLVCMFPKFKNYDLKDKTIKKYLLSVELFKINNKSYKLYALNQLYQLLKDTKEANKIRKLFNFTDKKFTALYSTENIFNKWNTNDMMRSSLYFSNHKEYNEKNKITSFCYVENNYFELTLDAKVIDGKYLRFDPDEGKLRKFWNVEISINGEKVEYSKGDMSIKVDDQIYFYTIDPKFYINYKQPIKEIRITGFTELLNDYEIYRIFEHKDKHRFSNVLRR